MHYQLNITLTEEDYLNFNLFHGLESKHGKKQIRNSRIIFLTIIVIFVALFDFIVGWSTFSIAYTAIIGTIAILYMLFLKKLIKSNIKKSLKKIKKTGKLPFDSVTKLEFFEDTFTEITESSSASLQYSILERICIVDERYLYLYRSALTAYIIPIPQLKEQLDYNEFLDFITQKCTIVEHYSI